MKKLYKILIAFSSIVLLLGILAFTILYYYGGINYFNIHRIYTKAEIIESAGLYHSRKVFLIRKSFFQEYGKGRFPKYKIYNPAGIQLDIYQCYESLPELPHDIQLSESAILSSQSFTNEIGKIREVNNDTGWQKNIFVAGKYNMIFYYKNAMDRIQKRQLFNILNNKLNGFQDSLHVLYVNVDAVNF